jgi:hypothetical protein
MPDRLQTLVSVALYEALVLKNPYNINLDLSQRCIYWNNPPGGGNHPMSGWGNMKKGREKEENLKEKGEK